MAVTVRGDTAFVTVLSLPINCCTEQVAPSIEITDAAIEIRVWEYMTDVCECFTRRSLSFALAPFDPGGRRIRLYVNGSRASCWDSLPLPGLD